VAYANDRKIGNEEQFRHYESRSGRSPECFESSMLLGVNLE
jgi:hypothetical protein